MGPLRSLNSLRRYVGSGDDWRQAVWNRWLVSYLTPRPEDSLNAPCAGQNVGSAVSDAPPSSASSTHVEPPAAPAVDSASPETRERVAASPEPDGIRERERPAPEPSSVEQRQLAARARLDAISQQMLAVESLLDSLGDRLQVRELSERRSNQRLMELIERVVETAERQSEALERAMASLERLERRLARVDRWVRPSGAESVVPPPCASGIVGLNGGVTDEVRSQRIPSMSGSLSDMSVATLLSMLEIERRTGFLTIEGELDYVCFELLEGCVVRGAINERAEEPLEILRRALGWRVGGFSFSHGAVAAGVCAPRSVGELLLEASRQNDEAVRMG